jgi:hypothetical protein
MCAISTFSCRLVTRADQTASRPKPTAPGERKCKIAHDFLLWSWFLFVWMKFLVRFSFLEFKTISMLPSHTHTVSSMKLIVDSINMIRATCFIVSLSWFGSLAVLELVAFSTTHFA